MHCCLWRGQTYIEILHKVDAFHNSRFQANSRQEQHEHGNVDHQPGHLLRCPPVEEQVTYKPVREEQPEARWPCNAAHHSYQAEHHTDLFIQGDQHQIVVPGLIAACHLLLLDPVIQPRPDTITDPATNIR